MEGFTISGLMNLPRKAQATLPGPRPCLPTSTHLGHCLELGGFPAQLHLIHALLLHQRIQQGLQALRHPHPAPKPHVVVKLHHCWVVGEGGICPCAPLAPLAPDCALSGMQAQDNLLSLQPVSMTQSTHAAVQGHDMVQGLLEGVLLQGPQRRHQLREVSRGARVEKMAEQHARWRSDADMAQAQAERNGTNTSERHERLWHPGSLQGGAASPTAIPSRPLQAICHPRPRPTLVLGGGATICTMTLTCWPRVKYLFTSDTQSQEISEVGTNTYSSYRRWRRGERA